MLHFAYGSNMDRALMLRRCPTAEAIGPARLDHWRFIVTRDGYASIIPASREVVHGVLWRLGPRDLAAVNAYESIDSGLYRRRMLPVRRDGCPRPGYQDLVVAAARAWNLPEDYIGRLERWVPVRLASPRAADVGESA